MTPDTTTNNSSTKAVITDIEERASRVRSMVENSVSIWLEVALEVDDAKKHLSKSDFELFLRKSALSRPIADKLLSIAKANILYFAESQKYLDKLEGWTTLYEVAKLSANDIRDLFDSIDDNPEQALTRSYIAQFKSKNIQQQDVVEIVATITLSTDRVQRLNRVEFQRFKKDLDEISQIISRSVRAAEISLKATKLKAFESLVLSPTSTVLPNSNSTLSRAVSTTTHTQTDIFTTDLT
jgi:hypothetical protein